MCRSRGQLRTRRQGPWQKQFRQTLGFTWFPWGGPEKGSEDKGEGVGCPSSHFEVPGARGGADGTEDGVAHYTVMW